jgi:nucleoside-diphosphate-sugar epimerase
MRVLITGAAGYMASRLIKVLVSEGHDVIGFDIKPPQEEIEFVQGDIMELPEKILKDIDAVIHLASISDDASANANPLRAFEINWRGTAVVAKACKRMGVKKFMFASTASIYARTLEEDTEPLGEEAEVWPEAVYAVSKYLAEKEIMALADEDFKPIIFRHGTVYGLAPQMRYNIVVHSFLRDALFQGRVKLHSGGKAYRPLVHLDDVAKVYADFLEKEIVGIFNMAEGNYRVKEVAEAVGRALGHPLEMIVVPSPLPPFSYRMKMEKMESVGFHLENNLVERICWMVKRIRERI